MGLEFEISKGVWDLLNEYTNMLAIHDMDLGERSLMKYSIGLADNMSFKSVIGIYVFHQVCIRGVPTS